MFILQTPSSRSSTLDFMRIATSSKYDSTILKYKLRDFIDPEKLNQHLPNLFYNNPNAVYFIEMHLNDPHIMKKIIWWKLSLYENAIPFLEKNLNKIDWGSLSKNPGAFELLIKNPDKIQWNFLCQNQSPWAIEMLAKNPDKIDWGWLSKNPHAIELLSQRIEEEKQFLQDVNGFPLYEPNHICWHNLTENPQAAPLLEKNIFKIDWGLLGKNPGALQLIQENMEKIDFNYLYMNPNPGVIHLLTQNVDKISTFGWVTLQGFSPHVLEILDRIPPSQKELYWKSLSQNPYAIGKNPCAIGLLEQNPDKIQYETLASNEAIFELNPAWLKKEQTGILKEELIAAAMHPRRIAWMLEQTGGELDGFI